MVISTQDAIIAGMQPPTYFLKVGGTMEAAGVLHSLLYTQGIPGPGVAPTPGVAGAALTTYLGQLPWTNPVSGYSYISQFLPVASQLGALHLYDRLWHNSGLVVTTTGAQTVNSVAWPARDRAGTTNGDAVLIGIEVSTATTNAAAITNTTMSYTNSAGTSGRTATIPSFPATAVAGTFVPFLLAAGDVGVRSIQSVTLGTSYGGGAIHLVAVRILARRGITTIGATAAMDVTAGGFVRLFDNTVPGLLWRATSTTAVTVDGELIVTQG